MKVGSKKRLTEEVRVFKLTSNQNRLLRARVPPGSISTNPFVVVKSARLILTQGTFADGAIALMYDFDEKGHQRKQDFSFATRTLSEFAIEGMI